MCTLVITRYVCAFSDTGRDRVSNIASAKNKGEDCLCNLRMKLSCGARTQETIMFLSWTLLNDLQVVDFVGVIFALSYMQEKGIFACTRCFGSSSVAIMSDFGTTMDTEITE